MNGWFDVPECRYGSEAYHLTFYAIPITPTVPATGDTTNEKGGEQRQELLPCPFCGESKASDFERNDEYYDDDLPTSEHQFRVICDATDGGCGSSTGFRKTTEAARKLWNTRK